MQQSQSSQKFESLNEYNGEKGNFAKTFLINDELNQNLWLANNEATLKNYQKWIGTPGIEYFNEKDERDHPPESSTYAEAVEKQKPYIKANIIDIGFDERSNNFWVIFQVTDEKFYDDILADKINFVSPSVMRTQGNEMGPIRIATNYIPVHVAFVDNPAYGPQAKIVGTCSRCAVTEAKEKFKPLIASLDNKSSQNTSFKSKTCSANQMDNKLEDQLKAEIEKNEKLGKEVASLSAGLEDLKKKVDQESANGDNNNNNTEKKKQESANGDDTTDTKKSQENANNETQEEEQKKEKQESAAVVQEIKTEKINNILQASKSQGVDEKTIEAHRNFLQAASIKDINEFAKIVNSSTVNYYPTQESASSKFPNLDEVLNSDLLEQFSASSTTEPTDGSDKLKELGVMS